MLNSNYKKKNYWMINNRPQGMSSKIFATKYQKAGKWRLILCMESSGPRVTVMLLFGRVTSTG